MSYSITVKMHGEQPEVTTSGTVPDGTHVISGHDSTMTRTISVSRHDPHGHVVASASSAHSKEQ